MARNEHVELEQCTEMYAFCIDNHPVGCIGASKMRNGWRIKCLYVMPKWREQGIGLSLIKAAINGKEGKITAFATDASVGLFASLDIKAQKTRQVRVKGKLVNIHYVSS